MPTPPKHWSVDTCPAHQASFKDRNVYFCPNDNCYFYRGKTIVYNGDTWSATVTLKHTARKTLQSLCNVIDRAYLKGGVVV